MNPAPKLLAVSALACALSCGGSRPASPEPAKPQPPAAAVPAKKAPIARRPKPEKIDPELLAELVDEDEYLTLGGPVGVVGGVAGGVIGGVIGGYSDADLEELMEAPPPPPPPKPRSIPPATLLAHRIEAGPTIAPGPSERRQILRSKAGRASVTIELCLSAQAEIVRTAVVGPSTYPSWENALMEAMWEWRFLPYDPRGTATAICSHLVFTYPESKSTPP